MPWRRHHRLFLTVFGIVGELGLDLEGILWLVEEKNSGMPLCCRDFKNFADHFPSLPLQAKIIIKVIEGFPIR